MTIKREVAPLPLEITEATIVSTDTLNPKHLIPKFTWYLNRLDTAKAAELGEHYADVYEALGEGSDLYEPEALLEGSGDLTQELFEALEAAAPEGFWFGASEGDGACFGFWYLEGEEPEEEESEFTVEFTTRVVVEAVTPEGARERAWEYLEGLQDPLQAVNDVEVL